MAQPIRLASACLLALSVFFAAVPSARNTPASAALLQPAKADAATADVRRAINAAKPSDRIRVIVRMTEARPGKVLPSANTIGKQQARVELVNVLQADAADAQRSALAYLALPEVASKVDGLRSFWVINGFALRATPDVIDALAARPDVESVRLDEVVTLDRASASLSASITTTLHAADVVTTSVVPSALADEGMTTEVVTTTTPVVPFAREPRIAPLASGKPAAGDATWGIKKIRADQVWKSLGITGQGVVVANIDSGVDWSHPSLQTRYRGYSGGPAADHLHNWYDATDEGAIYPSDADGHGTHTMGTIVGGDGIGVAPGATWMAVKGLTKDGGLYSWLHSAFQFILAPGGDPTYAPDILSNSWGTNLGTNTEFKQDLAALKAAGIFVVFSNGNRGPQGGTVGSPASLPGVIGVGASDPDDEIAYFSSRGPSPLITTEVKPTISAPGVDVASSFPGGGFQAFNGTSMAAPHVAGVAALLLSANPSLNITSTLFVMTSTARPLSTTVPNNISGWGRIDAYSATLSIVPFGSIVGSVRDGAQPIANATVIARDTAQGREATTTTGADGSFQLRATAGQYVVEAGAFGYLSATSQTRLVVTGSVATVDLNLVYLPSGSVRGTVRDAISGAYVTATVKAIGTPKSSLSTNSCLPCRYAIDLPSGVYTLEVRAAGYAVQTRTVTIADNVLLDQDFALQPIQRIALVDSGAYYYTSAAPLYRDAFDALQIGYDEFIIRHAPQDTPTITDLLKYDTVIWSAPYDAPSLVGASDVMSRYLAAGKNLLLTGQDVALYDGGGLFSYPPYFQRINAVYKGEGDDTSWVTGAPGTPIAGRTFTFTSAFKTFRPDIVTQLRPDGGPLIGNYNSDVNGYTGAGTWVWQCTKYRSAFYSFGLETLSLADRTEIVSRTLQAFVAPRPTLGIELTAQDAYFTGAAIGQPGSVATHVMRLRNSGDGGITQTITLDASGNVWPSKLSGTSFTLAPCATATVTMTTSIPDTLGWNASDAITVTSAIASSPVTRASVSFTTKTPAGVLLVDHDRFYNVEGSYASALAAQGNIADRWDTNWGVVITSTPSAAFLQQYPIVIWFNGYDWFDPLNKRDEKALRTYLDRGGRLFVASQSALQYQADSSLAANYLGVSKVEYEDGISITTRLDGTSLGDGIANGSLLPFPYNWNLSTAVQPMSGTQIFLLNNTGHPAGVLRDGAPGSRWRTALTPFAFEALSQPTRDDLMNGIVGWLSPLGQSSLNIDKHSAQPGDTVLFTIALRADDVISPTYVADHPASMSLTLPGGLTLISSTLTNGAWAGVVHNGDWLTWTASARVNEGLAAGTPLTASARFSLDDVGIGFTRQAVVRVGAPDLAASLSVNSPEPTWGGVVTLTLRLTNAAPVPSANTLVTVTLPHGMVVAAADSAGTRGDSESQTAAGQFVWRGAVGANETIAVTFAARLPKLTSSAAPVAFISAQVAGASGTTGSARLWLAPKTYWLRYPFMAR